MRFIRYSYLKEEGQLIIACGGEIISKKLISEFHSMFSELNINSPVNILLDLRAANLKASVKTSKLYANYFFDQKLYSYISKIAALTNSPAQVVQTMMFIDSVRYSGTSIKVFSTEDSAINWLNFNEDRERILNILQVLSNLVRPKKVLVM